MERYEIGSIFLNHGVSLYLQPMGLRRLNMPHHQFRPQKCKHIHLQQVITNVNIDDDADSIVEKRMVETKW